MVSVTSNLNRLVKNRKANKLVTPRLDEWLTLRNGELFPLSETTVQRLSEAMTASPRDRSGTFSSSSRGTCLRQQMLGWAGVKPLRAVDVVQANLFADGHFRHLRWQAMLLEAGILTDIEWQFGWPNTDQPEVRGSLDGVNANEQWGWELKGTRFFNQALQGPIGNHLLQIHTYMVCTGLKKFSLIYEDKSSQNWVEHVVVYDNQIADRVLAELSVLRSHVEQGDLPKILEDCHDGRGTDYTRCAYRSECTRLGNEAALPNPTVRAARTE